MRAFLDFLANNFGVYFESGSEIFLWFFNRAVAASWLILAVIVLRLLLKKAPRFITCALWGICALRLVLPFSLQSVLSLIPSAQTVVPETIYDTRPQIDSGIPIIDENVNAQITEQYYEGVTVPTGATLSFTSIIAIIWMIGILALLIYAVVSYIKLKRCVKGATMLEKGVFESAGVASPFILGVFSPKIYLPLNMDEQTKTYVLSHERAHLSRGDHIFKPLGFVILSLYWFSPLVWVAYILFCRDIELACDEKVVSKLEKQSRADYAQALLSCATQKRAFSACPLAFGEVSIKDRVKSALSYKKPMLWVIIAAVITAIVVCVCFTTDPISKKNLELTVTDYNSEVSGISLNLSSADLNSEKPYLTVNWHNDTDSEFTYGEAFSLERFKNGKYVSCAKGEVFFHEIAYMLSPNSSGEHTYYLDSLDISKAGKYKFSTGFNDEFEIYFTITKTSKEVNGFTDISGNRDNTSSSITSSDILKDETSSQPSVSSEPSKDSASSQPPISSKPSKDETSSQKDNSSAPSKDETSSNNNQSSYEKGWVLKDAYIPENNPSPIKVNGEDARTPTPISFTDEIIYGNLNFESKTINVGGVPNNIWSEWNNCIAIVDSPNQLKEIWQKEQGEYYEQEKALWEKYGDKVKFDENDYYVNWYDEKFFEDNTLIMLFFNRGALPYRIDKINVHNGRMYIYVNNRDDNGGILPAVSYSSRTFITVPNRYLDRFPTVNLDKIKDIVVYKDKH